MPCQQQPAPAHVAPRGGHPPAEEVHAVAGARPAVPQRDVDGVQDDPFAPDVDAAGEEGAGLPVPPLGRVVQRGAPSVVAQVQSEAVSETGNGGAGAGEGEGEGRAGRQRRGGGRRDWDGG